MKDFFALRIRPWAAITAVGFYACIGSLAGFVGHVAWWTDLGSHFRLQYVCLFALLAACYAWGRKWIRGVCALILLIINAAPVVFFLLPVRPYDASPGPSVKAVLANVNTQRGSPAKLAEFIQAENPDIIVLEEVNASWIKQLTPTLAQYTNRLIEERDNNFGIALLSRLAGPTPALIYFGSAKVPSIVADFTHAGQDFHVLATHPLPPWGAEYSRYRNEQLREVASYCRSIDGPLLLLGDLNVTPWSNHYRDFVNTSGLDNASRGRGLHNTWPTFYPWFRIPIDHCLHNEHVGIIAKRVGASLDSDHFPLILEFFIRRP